jgi:hypothetical protein
MSLRRAKSVLGVEIEPIRDQRTKAVKGWQWKLGKVDWQPPPQSKSQQTDPGSSSGGFSRESDEDMNRDTNSHSGRSDSNFNRPLFYPKLKF